MDIIDLIHSSNNIDNDILLYEFLKNKRTLEGILQSRLLVKLCTLGPEGTTSSEAAIFFKRYINKILNIDFELVFMNNFEDVHKSLLNEKVDLILIPNPYENITKIYWDENTECVYSFFLDTPEYGLVQSNKIKDDEKLIIASGPAVDSFINKLLPYNSIKQEYEVYSVNSTYEAAKAVSENKVHYGVTNSISASIYNLPFVGQTLQAKVLWTIFKKKKLSKENQ